LFLGCWLFITIAVTVFIVATSFGISDASEKGTSLRLILLFFRFLRLFEG
jgi:hypothetical protein